MRKRKTYKRRNTKSKRNRRIQLYTRMGVIIMMIIMIALGTMNVFKIGVFRNRDRYIEESGGEIDKIRPDIDVRLLTMNPYSGPGTATKRIRGIVIHYTANPGSTARQNRNYFEGLKDRHDTKASSHFIVGLDGEIVQCIPTWEVAYASNTRNDDTISIETCHPSQDGKYTEETYRSLVELTAWLCRKFDLNEDDIIRHYDVTGKNCPKYFVEHEGAWNKFKNDVKEALQ